MTKKTELAANFLWFCILTKYGTKEKNNMLNYVLQILIQPRSWSIITFRIESVVLENWNLIIAF